MPTRIDITDVATELLLRIDIDAAGCWLWTGTRTKAGYGQLGVSRRRPYAHRLSYQTFVGPIPDGLDVCHHCDRPPCINPDHLFTGTATDNALDMVRKGRARYRTSPGSRHPMAKLTDKQVLEIRRRVTAGENQHDLAAEFGVVNTTISMIHRRRIWRHL